jgi:hypothetical protein
VTTGNEGQVDQESVSRQTASEHDALVAALSQVGEALAGAAPGREPAWAQRVAAALRAVRQVLAQHQQAAEAADGLLTALAQAMPAAHYQLGKLRADHRALLDEATALLVSAEALSRGEAGSVDAIRRRGTALLVGLRHHQWQEVDLIYEAFDRDLGGG